MRNAGKSTKGFCPSRIGITECLSALVGVVKRSIAALPKMNWLHTAPTSIYCADINVTLSDVIPSEPGHSTSNTIEGLEMNNMTDEQLAYVLHLCMNQFDRLMKEARKRRMDVELCYHESDGFHRVMPLNGLGEFGLYINGPAPCYDAPDFIKKDKDEGHEG